MSEFGLGDYWPYEMLVSGLVVCVKLNNQVR